MRDDLPKGFCCRDCPGCLQEATTWPSGSGPAGFGKTMRARRPVYTKLRFAQRPGLRRIWTARSRKAGKPVQAIVANSAGSKMPALAKNRACAIAKNPVPLLAADLQLRPMPEILLISAGVIGAQFDMGKWRPGVPPDAGQKSGQPGWKAFTRAMMTTDAFPARFARCTLSGGEIRLCVSG